MPAADDPLLAQRRLDCLSLVRRWLRSQDGVEVLSQTSYGAPGGSGRPDGAFDAAADEADLQSAVLALEEPMRTACLISKVTPRDQGWFRHVRHQLERALGNRWVEWTWECEERYGQHTRPFEKLLDLAAEEITDQLGPGWF